MISRTHFVREVLGQFQEPYDTAVIVGAANARMSPQQRRNLGDVIPNDVHRFVYDLRHGKVTLNEHTPVKQPEKELNPEQYPVNSRGKANKRKLCGQVIREEEEKGNAFDGKRIRLIANQRLAQYPTHQKAGLTITLMDVRNSRQEMKTPRHSKKAGPEQKIIREEKPIPMAEPPLDSYTLEELVQGSKLLNLCGGSVYRSKQVLDILTKLKGDSNV